MKKIKNRFWTFINNNFSKIENLVFGLGILKKDKGRQPYHVAWLAPGKSLEDLKFYLHTEWGFGDHFVSFNDKGEVLNWRKLLEGEKQYHVRVYKDGEIRGHLEYMPEYRPMDHLEARGETEAKEEFLKFLGEYAVYEKFLSEVPLSKEGAYEPSAEFIPKRDGAGKDPE